MYKFILPMSLACVCAISASAQDVNGVISLGLGAGNIAATGGEDFDTTQRTILADLDLDFGNGYVLGLGFSNRNTTVYDAAENFDLESGRTNYSLTPRYDMQNGSYIGAYMQNYRIGVPVNIYAIELGMDSIGLFSGHRTDIYAIEVYAGQTQLTMTGGSSSDISAQNIGLSGSVMAAPNLTLFGHVGFAAMDNGDMNDIDDTRIIGAGFDYDLNDSWNIYGAGTSLDGSSNDAETMTQLVLGVGVDMSVFAADLPGLLTADWTRSNYFDVTDQDTFALGWTFGIGNTAPSTQNCTMRNAQGKNRAPLAATFDCTDYALQFISNNPN